MWADTSVLRWPGHDLNTLPDITCLYAEYLRNACKRRRTDGTKTVSRRTFEFDNVLDIPIFRQKCIIALSKEIRWILYVCSENFTCLYFMQENMIVNNNTPLSVCIYAIYVGFVCFTRLLHVVWILLVIQWYEKVLTAFQFVNTHTFKLWMEGW